MATIITRAGKGSPLTHNEVDANFTNLNTDKLESSDLTAGTGISIDGTTVTNTAPDQTVVLTGGGATGISGTYPNFTISSTDTNTTYTAGTGLSLVGTEFANTSPDQTVSITGSGIVSVSGTYPNFEVAATALQAADIGVSVQAYDANLTSFVSTFTLPTTDGTAGQVLSTDGAGNLALADAGGGGSFDFTANGAIASGAPVAINNDGSISEVQGTSGGSSSVALASGSGSLRSYYSTDSGKLIITYQTTSALYAIAGTVNADQTVTFGAPTILMSAGPAGTHSVRLSPGDGLRFIVPHRWSTNSAVQSFTTGRILGNSVIVGTAYAYGWSVANYTDGRCIGYNVNADCFVFVGRSAGSQYNPFAASVKVNASGQRVAASGQVIISTLTSTVGQTISDTSTTTNGAKHIALFNSGGNNYVTTLDVNPSTLAITFTGSLTFNSGTTPAASTVAMPFYSSIYNSVFGIYGSGTDIRYKTISQTGSVSPAFNALGNLVASSTTWPDVVYTSQVGGSSFYTFDLKASPVSAQIFTGFSGSERNLHEGASVFNVTNSPSGTALVEFLGANNISNFVGISQSAAADGETVTTTILGGVNEALSGLSVGQRYYLSPTTGQLTTSVGATTSVGRAIASNKILITTGDVA